MIRFLTGLAACLVLSAAGTPPPNPEGPFRHKPHAVFKMKCGACHTTAEKEEHAGFPSAAAQCKACHTAISDRELPSERVYRLADFVIFSHARHLSAKVECASCHGDVAQAVAMRIERPITMAGCVSCHKEHKATLVCTSCHELGQ